MAITALPDSTVNLLGSAQALTTPTSLVKELVDNALDAKATSIDILISPNTIDKIEVRDNGHGIPLEDLDALGRRGYTSKLRSFDELKSIGGVSLGFRGEALASAVQLGLVSVTTRTKGEAVATSVQLKAPGGIASQSRTSHPIGTKVSVTKFLYNLPVRKQTAEKESAKTLRKVKELLQSYAFARPKVRFCLKVASGGKGSWSFAPRPNDGMKETASQIIGRDAAAQCIESSLSFSEKSSQLVLCNESDVALSAQATGPQSFGSDHFIVEALISKPRATNIGHGQYISIDARPVAHDRGTMKKLVSIYKYYAKGSILEGDERLKDPFLWLKIKCPVSSYDPNVEPAKDDVIFQNESLVLESIEGMFKDVYGAPTAPSMTTTPQSRGVRSDDFELLMARNKNSEQLPISADHDNSVLSKEPTSPEETSESDTVHEPNISEELPTLDDDQFSENEKGNEGQNWKVDMSKDYSEEVDDPQRPNQFSQTSNHVHLSSPDVAAIPGNSLNPWIISKRTAPIRSKNIVTPPISAYPLRPDAAVQFAPSSLPTPQHSSDPISADSELLLTIGTARPRHMDNRDNMFTLASLSAHSSVQEDREEQGSLFIPGTSPHLTTPESDDGLLLGDDSEVFRRRNDFNTARDILNSPMQRFSGVPKKLKGASKSFVAPTRSLDHVIAQGGLRQTTLVGGTIYPTPTQFNRAAISLEPEQTSELEWAMDFERRKEHATRQRRKEILAARAEEEANKSAPVIKRSKRQNQEGESGAEEFRTQDAVRLSPHKNRYNAAIADLEASQLDSSSNDAKPFLKTSLPDGDPRAYFMRRQKSMQPAVQGGSLRPMRAKSTRLPLEKIPEAQTMHKLMLRYPVDIGAVQEAFQKSRSHDMYTSDGTQFKGLPIMGPEAKFAKGRIQAVVEKWKESCPETTYAVEFTFENLVDVK